jgi:hypothetical protein
MALKRNAEKCAVCIQVRSINLKLQSIYRTVGKYSTSFITRKGTDAPGYDCLKAFDRKGRLIHTLGIYARNDGYSSRFYGGYGCGDGKSPSTIARQAKRRTGKPAIFVKVKPRMCVRVPDANQCYNSSGC